jgi:uncharacterized phage protein gp47/JayE
MASLVEWVPLRAETIDTIRARVDANVNAGLDESDPRWQETVGGGFFYDHTQSMALEAEQLWDFGSTELPASFFLPFSWGIYLDYWGELLNLPRKAAVAATGEVRLTNASSLDQVIARGLEVAAPATTPEDSPIAFETAETVTVPKEGSVLTRVEAVDVGSGFNVSAGAVGQITSPSQELAVTNEDAISGGADEELDEPYKDRLLLEFQGSRGGGTRDDYIAQTLALGSVGSVVVQPHWAGPNTVRLIISDTNNQPLSPAVIEAVQIFWDPPAETGLGAGEAPIDAEVTVATVTVTTVNVAAKLELEPGFTLDGAGGTVNVTEAVSTVLTTYFHSLTAGERVQLNRVLAAFLSIEGVYDVHVKTLKLNGTEADVIVTALQSAQLGTVTLESEPAP